MQIDRDLVAAPATPFVLTVLSEDESYGYAILKRVRELSGSQPEWPDAMVYPLFHRLRRLGYVTSEWRGMPGGRRRRYYAITGDGRAVLAKWQRPGLRAMRAMDDASKNAGRLQTVLGEAWVSTVASRKPLEICG